MCISVCYSFEHVGEMVGDFLYRPCGLSIGLVVCVFLTYAKSCGHVATQDVHCGVEGMIVYVRHGVFSLCMFFVYVCFLAAQCDTCVYKISFMQQIVWAGIGYIGLIKSWILIIGYLVRRRIQQRVQNHAILSIHPTHRYGVAKVLIVGGV